MRILITGGFGFLGGRIAYFFAEQGHDVTITSRKNQIAPIWCPGVKVVKINWEDKLSLRNICKGIDLIIHAAGMNSIDSESSPSEALLFNGVATSRLLEASTLEKVNKFVFLSTYHVYKAKLSGLINEETFTENTNPYATSKRAGENNILWAHEKGQIQGIVLRLSNIIGAPEHIDVNTWGLISNDLCLQAVMKQKMTLNTTGKEYRNFLGITSFLNVLSEIIKHSFPPSKNTIFNIGNDFSISLIDMAEIIRKRCLKLLNKNIEIQTSNSQELDEQPSPFIFSTDKIKGLGIIIKQDLHFDIDSIIYFCKEHFSDHQA